MVALPEEETPVDVDRWLIAIHAESSFQWNREDARAGRQVRYQFWDRTLWTEGDFWSPINYIHGNPVKHGYVLDAAEYEWCSFREFEHDDPGTIAALSKFPTPRKLPGDDF